MTSGFEIVESEVDAQSGAAHIAADWTIPNFLHIRDNARLLSPAFVLAGSTFQAELFPFGWGLDPSVAGQYVSLYLGLLTSPTYNAPLFVDVAFRLFRRETHERQTEAGNDDDDVEQDNKEEEVPLTALTAAGNLPPGLAVFLSSSQKKMVSLCLLSPSPFVYCARSDASRADLDWAALPGGAGQAGSACWTTNRRDQATRDRQW
jgi:hypothetical protein